MKSKTLLNSDLIRKQWGDTKFGISRAGHYGWSSRDGIHWEPMNGGELMHPAASIDANEQAAALYSAATLCTERLAERREAARLLELALEATPQQPLVSMRERTSALRTSVASSGSARRRTS